MTAGPGGGRPAVAVVFGPLPSQARYYVAALTGLFVVRPIVAEGVAVRKRRMVRKGEFYRYTFWKAARMTFPLLPFVKPFTMLLRRPARPQDVTTWVRRFDP